MNKTVLNSPTEQILPVRHDIIFINVFVDEPKHISQSNGITMFNTSIPDISKQTVIHIV